jgi:hypothetical protein
VLQLVNFEGCQLRGKMLLKGSLERKMAMVLMLMFSGFLVRGRILDHCIPLLTFVVPFSSVVFEILSQKSLMLAVIPCNPPYAPYALLHYLMTIM